jgi:hypothetical protein
MRPGAYVRVAGTLAMAGALLSLATSQRALAQPASLIGRVMDAKRERPVAGALVEVRSLRLGVRADSSGMFRIRGVTAGLHEVLVRAVGYDPVTVRLPFAGNDSIESDFLMAPSVTRLAAVRVEAAAGERYAVFLREFEERRARGFGQFLDASFFESNEGRQVSGLLLSRIPGIRTMRNGTREFLASSRTGGNCLVQTIVNGVPMEFALNGLNASDIMGFEYYTVSTTPLRYNVTGQNTGRGTHCGTAIFWIK